jgi:hypothetical protein
MFCVFTPGSYIALVETYIERRLKEAFPGFEMDAFMQQLQQHEQEMDGSDVLEVLLSFGDFTTFKDIMLSYKTDMAGNMFHVDVRSSVLHLPQVWPPSRAHQHTSVFAAFWIVASTRLTCSVSWGLGAAWTTRLRIQAPLTRTGTMTMARKASTAKRI